MSLSEKYRIAPVTQERSSASFAGDRRVGIFFDPGSPRFLNNRLFDAGSAVYGGDNLLAPYIYLRQHLNRQGIEIQTADFLPDAKSEIVKLYVSSGNLNRYRSLARREDVTLSAYFAMECPTVEPGQYTELRRAQNCFRRIYSWSDSAALRPFVGGELRCLPMAWPQSFDSVHEEIWRNRDRRFLVLINGNKMPRYNAPCRELYTERLRAIEYFAKFGEIDLYGIGWGGPPYRVGQAFLPGTFRRIRMPGTAQRIDRLARTWLDRLCPDRTMEAARSVYRGVTESKARTLARYKFAICFENSVLKGWITEKIFDCFFAGTVPIYLGAPDIAEAVPREAFIDMREFRDFTEVRSFLHSLDACDIDRYRMAGRDFIGSSGYEPFTRRAFARIFDRIIEEDAAPIAVKPEAARA